NIIRDKFSKSLLANVKKARSNKINNSLQRETLLHASTSSNIYSVNHESRGNRRGCRGCGHSGSNSNDRM
ncbi:24282_t:CDS:2, partial [Gigaspora margarita]